MERSGWKNVEAYDSDVKECWKTLSPEQEATAGGESREHLTFFPLKVPMVFLSQN